MCVGTLLQKTSLRRRIWRQKSRLTAGGTGPVGDSSGEYRVVYFLLQGSSNSNLLKRYECLSCRLVLSNWFSFHDVVQIPLDGAPCQVPNTGSMSIVKPISELQFRPDLLHDDWQILSAGLRLYRISCSIT